MQCLPWDMDQAGSGPWFLISSALGFRTKSPWRCQKNHNLEEFIWEKAWSPFMAVTFESISLNGEKYICKQIMRKPQKVFIDTGVKGIIFFEKVMFWNNSSLFSTTNFRICICLLSKPWDELWVCFLGLMWIIRLNNPQNSSLWGCVCVCVSNSNPACTSTKH